MLNKPFAATQLLQVLCQLKPRGTVLVADDDPDFVDSIEPILEMAGYEVRTTGTGRHRRAAPGAERRCRLPDPRPAYAGDVRGRRSTPIWTEAGRAVPTVLVTGGSTDARSEAHLSAAACDVLYKPLRSAGLAGGGRRRGAGR